MSAIDFHAVFDALASPYMVIDRNFDYVAVNAAYEQVLMRPREQLLGGNLFSLFPNDGESGRRLRQSFERVFATGQSDTIAYIPYEIPIPGDPSGASELRYWTAVHTPIRGAGGTVDHLMQNTVDVTELVKLQEAASLPFRTISGEIELIQRAQEAEKAYAATMSANEDFKRLFQQSPSMIAVLRGPRHVVTFANDAYQRFVGNRAIVGRSILEALPEVEGQGYGALLDRVFEGGTPYIGEGIRIEIARGDGQAPRDAFVDFSCHPIRDAQGRTTGVFVQGMDRTEHFRSAERQRLLIDELNHRVKNTLATVQSIARQSFRDVEADAARRAFEARILALSKAHNMLSERMWDAVTLSDLVAQELAAFPSEQAERNGPMIELRPKAAIAFAMVLHELATNAAKYGALSSATGRVCVRWTRSSERDVRRLGLEWRESGGPPVTASPRRGFGTRMIRRIVEGELDGRVDLDLASSGLVFSMEIAMDEVEQLASGDVA